MLKLVVKELNTPRFFLLVLFRRLVEREWDTSLVLSASHPSSSCAQVDNFHCQSSPNSRRTNALHPRDLEHLLEPQSLEERCERREGGLVNVENEPLIRRKRVGIRFAPIFELVPFEVLAESMQDFARKFFYARRDLSSEELLMSLVSDQLKLARVTLIRSRARLVDSPTARMSNTETILIGPELRFSERNLKLHFLTSERFCLISFFPSPLAPTHTTPPIDHARILESTNARAASTKATNFTPWEDEGGLTT